MFQCRRCGNEFPDDIEECPVCGTVNRKMHNKQTRSARILMYLADLSIIAMSFFSTMNALMCSHYCIEYEYGLFIARQVYWHEYPALVFIDIFFMVCFVSTSLLSLIAWFKTNRREKSGVKMTICLYVALLLLNIMYPIATYLATSIVTPILMTMISVCSAFLCIAIILSILLLKNKEICF